MFWVLLQLSLACRTDPTSQSQTKTHDFDGDGYTEKEGDCDDESNVIYPGAEETCDGLDNNCNEEIDEGVMTGYYLDADGDGYGPDDSVEYSCEPLEGRVAGGNDCNDNDSNINPAATEICDDIDNDCNGDIDEYVGDIYYVDNDGDGYGGQGASETIACEAPAGYADNDDDCDDSDPTVLPGGSEYCDDIDNNCDGNIDEEEALDVYDWYLDADSDGYGDSDIVVQGCVGPEGYSANGGDCNDGDGSINPGSTEVCDEVDNDCDSLIDDADDNVGGAADWFLDYDADGYGNPSFSEYSCDQPAGYVVNNDDCDDLDSLINPDAVEICDLLDNDCNADVDDADSGVVYNVDDTWYLDGDGDGYGDVTSTTESCAQPSGYVPDNTDCDDSEALYNPATAWYLDDDSDDYGDGNSTVASCTQPAGYVLDDTDCDDSDPQVSPRMAEICNDSIDQDCDTDITASTCSLSLADASSIIRGPVNSYFGKNVRYGGNLAGTLSVAVSANRDDTIDANTGAVYIFATSQLNGEIQSTAAPSMITGTLTGDQFGTHIATTNPFGIGNSGDVNGDGFVDLLVAAPEADNTSLDDRGKVYLFEGPVLGTLAAETDATAILFGEADGDEAGSSIDFMDVNDDGFADVIIGASLNSNNGSQAGAAYLIHGPVSSGDLSNSDVAIYGDNSLDYFGSAVLNAGDVNGDGVPDLLISAYRGDPVDPVTSAEVANAGISYLFFGPILGALTPSNADVMMYGDSVTGYSGREVSQAGDVNGDGFADIIIGARDRLPTGSAYIVSGDSSMQSELWLYDATAKLDGESAGDQFGKSSARIGDINADGFDDVVIGAKKASNGGTESGAMYLYYGPLIGTYEPGDYHGVLAGEGAGDQAGISVAGLNDIDGNGRPDILTGAYFNSSNGVNAGAAYYLLGEDLQQ